MSYYHQILIKLKELWRFIDQGIWGNTKHNIRDRIIMTIYISIKRVNGDNLFIKAAALTFSTLLSIVPLFALLFAIVKGFGFSNLFEAELFDALPIDRATFNQTLAFIDNYLSQTKDGLFIGIGLLFLLWTVWGLIASIEDVFNDIWRVKESRSTIRRFTDYFSFIFAVPIILIISSGASLVVSPLFDKFINIALLGPIISTGVKLIPILLTWMLFTFIYVLIPNTKVKFTNAIVSGLLASIAFNFFQMLYINGQIWVTRYSAIYGSFAALPLLMLWIHASWLICLIGAEITFAGQNIENLQQEKFYLDKKVSRWDKDFLALLICSLIVKRVINGEAPYTASQLATKCFTPLRLTQEVLNKLISAGIVKDRQHEQSKETEYIPYIDINNFSVGTLFDRLEKEGNENLLFRTNQEFMNQWSVFAKQKGEATRLSSHILIKDL